MGVVAECMAPCTHVHGLTFVKSPENVSIYKNKPYFCENNKKETTWNVWRKNDISAC